jgi:hypothetical protein
MEMKLLKVFCRSVKSVITVALTNGASRMIHGRLGFMKFGRSEF